MDLCDSDNLNDNKLVLSILDPVIQNALAEAVSSLVKKPLPTSCRAEKSSLDQAISHSILRAINSMIEEAGRQSLPYQEFWGDHEVTPGWLPT